MAPFKTLRFMDWGATNGSTQVNWTDRPLTTDAFWANAGKGVPSRSWSLWPIVECRYVVQCATSGDDAYVTNAATLIQSNLGSQQHLYLEYSNGLERGFPGWERGCGRRAMLLAVASKR